jgi:tripartite-type tricarboxylate transporter receptor subunit TctC
VRPLFLAWAILFATTVVAQEWPQKAVRIIVPFPPGGSADLLPRYIGEKLSQQWGQPVIVDNRPGAAGNIGAAAAYQAEPDGYTLLSAPPPPLVINRLLYPKLGYDSTQFVPMSVIAAIPNVLLVNPNKGTAPALADLLGGQVDLMFDNLGVSLPHVRAGKLKALAVASRARVSSLPGTPTLAESLPGFEAVAWFGIVGPPKTSSAIAEKVAAGVAEALKNPDVLRRLGEMAAEPMGLAPAATAAFMKQEAERWSAVIRSAGVKLE